MSNPYDPANNPYDPSNAPGPGPLPASSGAASQAVTAPAICLIVAAAIGMPIQLFGIVNNAISMNAPQQALEQQGQMPEGMDAQTLMTIVKGAGAVGIVFNLIAIAVGAFIIFAAMKMKNLQSLGMAKTAAIISMLPCISPCCLLGLPFGIWSLIVLSKPEVSSAFR